MSNLLTYPASILLVQYDDDRLQLLNRYLCGSIFQYSLFSLIYFVCLSWSGFPFYPFMIVGMWLEACIDNFAAVKRFYIYYWSQKSFRFFVFLSYSVGLIPSGSFRTKMQSSVDSDLGRYTESGFNWNKSSRSLEISTLKICVNHSLLARN